VTAVTARFAMTGVGPAQGSNESTESKGSSDSNEDLG
jgi:hypothetical protein